MAGRGAGERAVAVAGADGPGDRLDRAIGKGGEFGSVDAGFEIAGVFWGEEGKGELAEK